jgi:hypothetical protein
MKNDEIVDEASAGAVILQFPQRTSPTEDQVRAMARLREYLEAGLELATARHAYLKACERIGLDMKDALNEAERPFWRARLTKQVGQHPVES